MGLYAASFRYARLISLLAMVPAASWRSLAARKASESRCLLYLSRTHPCCARRYHFIVVVRWAKPPRRGGGNMGFGIRRRMSAVATGILAVGGYATALIQTPVR